MLAAPYVIRTRRLGLRRLVATDVHAIGEVFADPYAARFYPSMQSPQGPQRWIDWNLKNYEVHGFGLWALEALESGAFIGDAGITWQEVEAQRILEIGWHVHPDFRNQGYATEAGKACLQFGFESLGASVLHSIVDPQNIASRRVAGRVHERMREYPGKSATMQLFSTRAPEVGAG